MFQNITFDTVKHFSSREKEPVVNFVTNSAMDKNSKKRNSYNAVVMNHLSKKYGFSKNYIRECLNGTRKLAIADILKKEYTEALYRINEALKK